MASFGQLAAGIAHEINTPAGAVISAADVSGRCISRMEATISETESIEALRSSGPFSRTVGILKENTEVSLTAGSRITTIVTGLRDFVRLDGAEIQFVDLREGIDATLSLLGHEIGTGIDVVRNFDEIPPVRCSPSGMN